MAEKFYLWKKRSQALTCFCSFHQWSIFFYATPTQTAPKLISKPIWGFDREQFKGKQLVRCRRFPWLLEKNDSHQIPKLPQAAFFLMSQKSFYEQLVDFVEAV